MKLIKIIAEVLRLSDSSIWSVAALMLTLDHSSEQSESVEVDSVYRLSSVIA